MMPYYIGDLEIEKTNKNLGFGLLVSSDLAIDFEHPNNEGWRLPTRSEASYFVELANLGVGGFVHTVPAENPPPQFELGGRYWIQGEEEENIPGTNQSDFFKKLIFLDFENDQRWTDYGSTSSEYYEAFLRLVRSK